MGASMKSLGIDRLRVEERLALVEEIWNSIAADSAAVPLTDAQRATAASTITKQIPTTWWRGTESRPRL